MRLGLSSAAAPDAGFEELLAACARRGIAGLELREGDAHGVCSERAAAELQLLRDQATSAGIGIEGVRASRCEDTERLALLSATLAAPLIVDGPEPIDVRIACAQRVRELGGAALVAVGGPAAEWLPAVVHAGAPVAWTADPAGCDLGGEAEAILHSAFPLLRSVLLPGGGPETAMHGGRGVGALMSALALAAFDGAIVIAPGDPRHHVAWSSWLGRRGGWGCGSAGGDPQAVQLPRTGAGAR